MEMQEIPKETEKAKEGDEGPSEPMLEVKKEGKKKEAVYIVPKSKLKLCIQVMQMLCKVSKLCKRFKTCLIKRKSLKFWDF